MENLRWGKRFPTALKARFEAGNRRLTGFIDDLSVFGFFLRSNQAFPPATLLQIEIQDPQGRVIRLEGSVQWQQQQKRSLFRLAGEAGMGIKIQQFLSGQEAYDNLCQKLCHDAGPLEGAARKRP